MLLEVYGRAARTRRRRQATAVLGAGAATLLAATGLSLVRGADDEARVHVIDRGEKNGRTAVEEPARLGTTAGGQDETGTEKSTPSSQEAGPSGRRHEAALPPPADRPVTAPSVTTAAAPVRLLAQVEDTGNDAYPNHWYLDVVRGSVELDAARDVLVFTTTYRSADAGAGSTRADHTMTSEVQYDNTLYAVTVVERDHELSEPELDEAPCSGCTASFNPSTARLTVTVPLSTFNNAVAARGSGNPPFASSSAVDDLVVATKAGSGVAAVDADSSRNPEVQP